MASRQCMLAVELQNNGRENFDASIANCQKRQKFPHQNFVLYSRPNIWDFTGQISHYYSCHLSSVFIALLATRIVCSLPQNLPAKLMVTDMWRY